MAWYRTEPIPALGGRTAESLVEEGMADDVHDYLDRLTVSVYGANRSITAFAWMPTGSGGLGQLLSHSR